jgi:hypothetical protein
MLVRLSAVEATLKLLTIKHPSTLVYTEPDEVLRETKLYSTNLIS